MEGLSVQPQIPFEELILEKEIGRGHYGKVCLGRWKNISVALKFCRERGSMDDFIREANVMMYEPTSFLFDSSTCICVLTAFLLSPFIRTLPPHPNVVRFYGISIDGPQPVIVLEYCAGGSLDVLLFDKREIISNEDKIKLVKGIAAGMYHLHKHNIVHRDLAARNILLSENGEPKISVCVSSFHFQNIRQQGMVLI
jgi:c-src tyrosine kinase